MLFSMAGLVKAKKYDWKDSNLALFGSDVEKNVRFINVSAPPELPLSFKFVAIDKR